MSDPPIRLQVIGQNLKVDLVTIEVVEALSRDAHRALLLKGASFASWLYPAGETRSYNDCDLLIPPSRHLEVGTVLYGLGFERRSKAVGPADRPVHAENWQRRRDGAVVDLHLHLIGVGLEPEAAFDLLASTSELLDVRGTLIPVLGEAARTVHVALHAAQHGHELKKALTDLQQASKNLPLAVWSEAHLLARHLDAIDAFSEGLSLLPSGKELVKVLELPQAQNVEAILRASTAEPLSLGFEWLSRAPGIRPKVRFVFSKLFPPPSHMRMLSSGGGDSLPRLAGLYIRRLCWMAPKGFAAWLAARKEARGRSRTG